MKNNTVETLQKEREYEEERISRREYLIGLKKWSKIAIGAVVFGGVVAGSPGTLDAASWVNNRGNGGNGWRNNGGGTAWVNRRGNGSGGGAWANNPGGGGLWRNNGNSWGNSGGGSWINRN